VRGADCWLHHCCSLLPAAEEECSSSSSSSHCCTCVSQPVFTASMTFLCICWLSDSTGPAGAAQATQGGLQQRWLPVEGHGLPQQYRWAWPPSAVQVGLASLSSTGGPGLPQQYRWAWPPSAVKVGLASLSSTGGPGLPQQYRWGPAAPGPHGHLHCINAAGALSTPLALCG
jgi:hypothetical protein